MGWSQSMNWESRSWLAVPRGDVAGFEYCAAAGAGYVTPHQSVQWLQRWPMDWQDIVLERFLGLVPPSMKLWRNMPMSVYSSASWYVYMRWLWLWRKCCRQRESLRCGQKSKSQRSQSEPKEEVRTVREASKLSLALWNVAGLGARKRTA